MKLYTSMGPNPLKVELFIAEKSLTLPLAPLDILGGDTRTSEFKKINTLQELPALELDDGSYLTESLAICQYLEACHPQPPLLGESNLERARIRMWTRRMEQQLFDKAGDYGLHTMSFFVNKITQVPAYAESLVGALEQSFYWLDSELADGRSFIVGDNFTMADIIGMATLFILKITDLEIPDNAHCVNRWASAVMERPSWKHCAIGIEAAKASAM